MFDIKKMSREEAVEMLTNIIEELDYDTYIQLNNDICESNSDYENMVYDMSEIDEFLYGVKPSELFDKIDFDEFKPRDDYFRDSMWGLQSDDDPTALGYDAEDIAKYILDECDPQIDQYYISDDYEKRSAVYIETSYNDHKISYTVTDYKTDEILKNIKINL